VISSVHRIVCGASLAEIYYPINAWISKTHITSNINDFGIVFATSASTQLLADSIDSIGLFFTQYVGVLIFGEFGSDTMRKLKRGQYTFI